MKILKKIRQITGTCIGITLTKEEQDILGKAKLGDIVSVEKKDEKD